MEIPVEVIKTSDSALQRQYVASLGVTPAPLVFRYKGGLLIYNAHQFEARVFTTKESTLVGKALAHGGIVQLTSRGNGGAVKPATLDFQHLDLLGTMVLHNTDLLPAVELIYRLPSYRPGATPARAGFDPVSRTLYVGEMAPVLEPVSNTDYLRRWFSGLQTNTEYDRNHLICYAVSCFARHFCEFFPILILDSAAGMSGKTSTSAALAYLVMGEDVPDLTFCGDEGKNEFRIGAFANRPGPTPIRFDNLRPKRGITPEIRSQALSSAATSRYVLADVKLRNPSPIFSPIFILTMNCARVENDLSSKSFFVKLMSSTNGKPLDISPHPHEFVRENRTRLLAEIDYIYTNLTFKRRGQHETRFFNWEDLMYSIGEYLGLELKLSAAHAREYDNLFLELFEHMFAEGSESPGEASLDSVLVRIMDYPGQSRELSTELRNKIAYTKARKLTKFVEFLEARVLGRPFHAMNQTWQFSCRDDKLICSTLP